MAGQGLAQKFIGLAPMEGVTDFPARIWFSLAAAWDVLCTPFLRVTDDYPHEGQFPVDFCPELTRLKGYVRYPLVPQLMGTDARRFVQVAAQLLPDSAMIDLNCGCPAPKVVGKGAGSALLSDPELFFDLIEKIVAQLGPGVVSVKMRSGFYQDGEFGGLLTRLYDFPLYWLNVHGRTRLDRYRGEARWALAALAAERAPWPVVGSGDIVSYEKYLAMSPMLRLLKGVFVGRGALRNPWLYTELRTGRKVTLSFGLLKTSLYVYACLAHVAANDLEGLINICKELDLSSPCGDNHDLWQRILERLCVGIAASPARLAVSSKILGRVKMVWRSLRTSLPPCFMDAAMTQSQTLADFMDALEEVYRTHLDGGDLTLGHDPGMDHWFAR